MKDAYSFDSDEAGLDVSYKKMLAAYKNIFDRCGVPTVAVQAQLCPVHLLTASVQRHLGSFQRPYVARLGKMP